MLRARTAARVLVALAAVALLFLLGRQGAGFVPQFAEWVDGLGFWGPLVFILAYAVATVAFIPGSALTLAAGAIFGLAEGTVYAFSGAFLGAAGAFLVARYVARGWVEGKLAGKPRFAAVDRAVGAEGGKIVALLRLSPVFPFNLLNYALGLTGVRFLPYCLASFAMLPGTLLYVYYGKVAGEVASAVSGETGGGNRLLDWLFLGIGLLATVAVTWLITKRAKKALDDALARDGDGDGGGDETGNGGEEMADG